MSIHIGNLHSTINWWTLPAAIPYVIEGWSSPLARHFRERLSSARPAEYLSGGRRELQILALLLIAALTYPLTAATLAASRPLAQFSSAVEEAAHAASPAVVQISVRGRARVEEAGLKRAGHVVQRDSEGSGIILESDGYILTNAHVVSGARSISVSIPARGEGEREELTARVVGVDAESDLAVLKVEAKGLPTLSFGDSKALRQGQAVLVLGSPLGLENSLTLGCVSAPVRYIDSGSPLAYVQTDAPINPGNSGGPLLDIEGRVVGVNTMILSQSGGSEGIGLAIPSNTVRRVYEQLRTTGHASHGSVGVVAQDVTPVMAAALGIERRTGVVLADVLPQSPASAAGLQAGDLVLAIDDEPVKLGRQVRAAVFQHLPGETLLFDLLRGKERIRKTVIVSERRAGPTELAELATESGRLLRPLGILAVDLDHTVAGLLPEPRRDLGVVVAAIPSESASANPGLEAADIIYEVNGKSVTTVSQLVAELSVRKSGDAVALLVESHGTLGYVAFELE